MYASSPIFAVRNSHCELMREAAFQATELNVGLKFGLSMIQVMLGTTLHSHALIASGLYMLAGLMIELVSLFAVPEGKISETDKSYQNFQHCVSTAWLIFGLALMTIGCVLSGQAVREINAPGTIPQIGYSALSLLVLALLVKSAIFYGVRRLSGLMHLPMPVARLDQVFAENASMLLVGAGMSASLAGYRIFEPVATMAVGLMVIGLGAKIALNAGRCLRDRLADACEINEIRDTLLDTPGVSDVRDLHIQKIADMLMVDVLLELDATLSVKASYDIAAEARRRALARHRVVEINIQTTLWHTFKLV